MSVINMDCITGMGMFPDNHFDSIVCDPPYELGFMGKSWDSTGIAYNVEMWREALRVLKPGGHLLAFSGSRTYHRMACAIEDAGFDLRDQIMWVYGSGFPKSLDVSKAIDKAAGAVRPDAIKGGHRGMQRDGGEDGGSDGYKAVKDAIGHGVGCGASSRGTAVTDAARQWEGWGTALKPAHEAICVARKPLVGTVVANLLEFGTGAINIDGCRVEGGARPLRERCEQYRPENFDLPSGSRAVGDTTAGRWPANLIHDGSDEVVALFPKSSVTGARTAKSKASEVDGTAWLMNNHQSTEYTDSGSAARFFYCPKASKSDRGDGNIHPTVKPTELMRYLCRLVTPPGGRVMDPFAGSGSTGKAAKLEGFEFIGFELSAEYAAIANRRIK